MIRKGVTADGLSNTFHVFMSEPGETLTSSGTILRVPTRRTKTSNEDTDILLKTSHFVPLQCFNLFSKSWCIFGKNLTRVLKLNLVILFLL